MKSQLFKIILLFGAAHIAKGQQFLVLKDGEKIEYTSLKGAGTEVISIKTVTKKKLQIPVEKVLGKYNLTERKFYHLLPIRPVLTGTLADIGKASRDYDFMERVYEGKINFYERVTYTAAPMMGGPGGGMMGAGGTRTIEFFVEKNNEVHEIKFRSGLLPAIRKKRIDSLISVLGDCPEILSQLDDENFEFGHDNVINLIRDYNVCQFEPTSWPLQNTNAIAVYTKVKRAKDQIVSISVNDSTMVNIQPNGVVPVNISYTRQNKVCVKSKDLTTCDILLSSPYFIKHYEILLNEKRGKLEIEGKSYEEAQAYLMEVRRAKILSGQN